MILILMHVITIHPVCIYTFSTIIRYNINSLLLRSLLFSTCKKILLTKIYGYVYYLSSYQISHIHLQWFFSHYHQMESQIEISYNHVI